MGLTGSCWAFAAVAAIESLQKIQEGGELLSLSEQQLIDCSAGGVGCIGWDASRAFQWIAANGGIAGEASYPYTGTSGIPLSLFSFSKVISLISLVCQCVCMYIDIIKFDQALFEIAYTFLSTYARITGSEVYVVNLKTNCKHIISVYYQSSR